MIRTIQPSRPQTRSIGELVDAVYGPWLRGMNELWTRAFDPKTWSIHIFARDGCGWAGSLERGPLSSATWRLRTTSTCKPARGSSVVCGSSKVSPSERTQ